MTQTPSTKDQAQRAASTAADEGRHVAGVATDEARSVAGEAQAHARGLLDEAMVQVDEQTRTQRDRVAGTLQTFGDDLTKMASNGGTNGLAAELAHQAADRARALGQHLDGREPSDLLDDVRRFARRRPGTFLIGALATGVVAGRLARGAKDASSTPDVSGTPTYPVAPVVEPTLTDRPPMYGEPTLAVPVTGPTSTPTPFDDPLGLDDPSVGATVPPSASPRYEP